jgi:hypothetical protein
MLIKARSLVNKDEARRFAQHTIIYFLSDTLRLAGTLRPTTDFAQQLTTTTN